MKRLALLSCIGLVFLVMLAGYVSTASAQTVASLAAGNYTSLPGATVDVSISLTPGSVPISVLLFELLFPTPHISSPDPPIVTAGGAAVAAGKQVAAVSITGGIRILVAGGIQAVGAGSVAVARLTIAASAPPGTYPLTLANISTSDPTGMIDVPVTPINGAITVGTPADTTPPVISSVSASNISSTGATISWTTNEPSDTQVEYGTTTSYGSSTVLNSSMVTSHSQNLTGLTPSTLYHYRVRSRDAAGNLAVSADYTFTTSSSSDTTPPIISGVTVTNITHSSAVISWSTNEPANSQVQYGTSTAYGSITTVEPDLVTSHSRELTGLAAKTLYHFRVISADATGNQAVSQDLTFTTAERGGPDDVQKTFFVPRRRGKKLAQANGSGEEHTGVALVNLDSSPATLTFTACDSSGAALSDPGLTNPVTKSLEPGHQLPVVDTEIFGPGLSLHEDGWIKVQSNVEKIAGFFTTFDSELNVLDGTVLASLPAVTSILSEIEAEGFTWISIENPNSTPANVTIELIGNGGNVLARESKTINANGSLAAELFEDIFEGTVPPAASYLRITSDKPVVPLELTGKEGVYASALNGQDASAGTSKLYCPQYAVGGSWRTALSVVNLDARAGLVTFTFVPQDPSRPVDTKSLPINGHGKLYIDDPAFFESLAGKPADEIAQGYVVVEGDGIRLAGSVVFGDAERRAFSTALPLLPKLDNSLLFGHVAANDTYFTGLAIVNPHDREIFAIIDLVSADGKIVYSATQVIPPRGRSSRLLAQYFPILLEQHRTSGYIRVTADLPVAGFAVFGTNSLSVLSAIPPQTIP